MIAQMPLSFIPDLGWSRSTPALRLTSPPRAGSRVCEAYTMNAHSVSRDALLQSEKFRTTGLGEGAAQPKVTTTGSRGLVMQPWAYRKKKSKGGVVDASTP